MPPLRRLRNCRFPTSYTPKITQEKGRRGEDESRAENAERAEKSCEQPSRRRRSPAGARRVTRSRKQAALEAPAVCFRDPVALLLARSASRRNGTSSRFLPVFSARF